MNKKTNEKKTIETLFKVTLGITDSKIIELLETSCFVVKKQKGEIIFTQNDKGSVIYYLLDGRIKLYRLDEKGNECIIHFVNKNEFFAEILLTQNVYPVTAQTLTNTIILGIDKDKLFPLLKSHTELSLNIIFMFAKRINYLVDTIERLSIENAKERFLNYLNYLSKIQKSLTVVLDVPKQEIALLLGMAKETFSRIEKQLVSDGIIEVSNKQIKIKEILP
ncbi:MAG: Crp/Fnr family transcriptional regulator [Desulfurella sp.]|uniref:Crp/Fnr family transcriptional regulator n=1 Tax=Desulfurella sp. TaxID=1962857 RepID=UPI003CA9D911